MRVSNYLSSVEFHSKTSRIPKSFKAAALMYDSGKPDNDRGLDTRGTKEISACELRNVMSDLKEPFGTSSSGMNNALALGCLVELKNGETYNRHLVNCDTWMNVHLRAIMYF
ncbi:hypothetical protein RHGRI_030418 [Rhododendron griersonianum]|uniref:Uncharacterized protein n=1 Tax=Rhododendron griersonianum TaxID=479676 RepID=A0AAV6IN28_9ERIC|nr:hypothetical protein RHGRI_030418 [Rhododendron griersonianum]